MARKNNGVNTSADATETHKEVTSMNDAAPPEIIRNHDTLTEREVLNYLEEGFQSVAARAVVSSDVLGQAELLAADDKQQLVGKTMVILGWRFNEGAFADEFVSVLVLTEDDRYYVFNDSSTGVYQQIRAITDRIGRQYGPIVCRSGLRASDYHYDEATGQTYTIKPTDVKTIPARTYYLS